MCDGAYLDRSTEEGKFVKGKQKETVTDCVRVACWAKWLGKRSSESEYEDIGELNQKENRIK